MSKLRAKDQVLGELHVKLAQALLDKINSGEATPADYNAAIKFLQANKIEAETVQDNHLDRLTKALPSFDDEQDEATLN